MVISMRYVSGATCDLLYSFYFLIIHSKNSIQLRSNMDSQYKLKKNVLPICVTYILLITKCDHNIILMSHEIGGKPQNMAVNLII